MGFISFIWDAGGLRPSRTLGAHRPPGTCDMGGVSAGTDRKRGGSRRGSFRWGRQGGFLARGLGSPPQPWLKSELSSCATIPRGRGQGVPAGNQQGPLWFRRAGDLGGKTKSQHGPAMNQGSVRALALPQHKSQLLSYHMAARVNIPKCCFELGAGCGSPLSHVWIY